MTGSTTPLRLSVPELRDGRHWRWLLTDADGTPLADHEVTVDPDHFAFGGFEDLDQFVRRHADPDRRSDSEEELIARVGGWIGDELLGAVGLALLELAPVTVEVSIPANAEWLMFRPWELARIDDSVLVSAGVSLVFTLTGLREQAKEAVVERLRMLAVFSLPTDHSVLALRRERYELQRLVRHLAGRGPSAIELSVLQYGVTRDRLRHAAQDGAGWDLLHMSGHGLAHGLLLERADGSGDLVETPDLVELLRPLRRRTKLVVLSSCQSGAARAAETLRWLRLDEPAAALDAEAASDGGGDGGVPALGRSVMETLDAAVVAMRYPVADQFAIHFAGNLYELLLDRGQPLDEAVRNALPAAVAADGGAPRLPALSIGTPTLLGQRAIGLRLRPPVGRAAGIAVGGARMAGFDDEPPRFVGRAATMSAATAALATESSSAGVLFHGIAGAGKTSCALELSYRHETSFAAHAFWRAPERPEEALGALSQFAQRLETLLGPQLDGGFAMAHAVASDTELDRFLPQLTQLLERAGLLIVLDNIETLLTDAGAWRDPRWGRVVKALTDHRGLSRVVMTSRVVPQDLEPAVLTLPVGSLSLAEAALLARELPHLGGLMSPPDLGGASRDPVGDRALVRRVLAVVQGHPKLLELADAAAVDVAELEARLAGAEQDAADRRTPLETFFTAGESELAPQRFIETLAHWTTNAATALDGAAQLLLQVLSCMEEGDRVGFVLDANWGDICERAGDRADRPPLSELLDTLVRAALVERSELASDAGGDEDTARYEIHPGIAETMRALSDRTLQRIVDEEIAAYWMAVLRQALDAEQEHATGGVVLPATLSILPYLVRLERWGDVQYVVDRATMRSMNRGAVWRLLPYIRHAAEVTGNPVAEGILGQVLAEVDVVEAEQHLRRALAAASAANMVHTVSAVYEALILLLARRGAYEEALALCDERAARAISRRDPWEQLGEDVQRMQLRVAIENPTQLVDEVERLVAYLDELPEPSMARDRMFEPWKLRENLFDVAHSVNHALGRWREAIGYNRRSLESMIARGAPRDELAGTALNDATALIELARLDACQQLLDRTQEIFASFDDTDGLAVVFATRGRLEAVRGHPKEAIGLLRTALRLEYVAPEPFGAQVRHHNLGMALQRAAVDLDDAAAHVLASALLCRQCKLENELELSLRALASVRASADGALGEPASAAELVEHMAAQAGVRFGELFSTLTPDEGERERLFAEIADPRRSEALTRAMVAARLDVWQEAIEDIIRSLSGDTAARTRIEELLVQLEHVLELSAIVPPLRRVLSGERGDQLLAGLDLEDTAVMRHVLLRLEATEH